MLHNLRFSTFLLILVLLFAVPIGSQGETKFGKVTDEEWQMGAPEDYPEANAIVVVDDGFIDVTSDRIKIERLRRIKVFTKAGFDEVGELSVRYHEEYDKLKGFEAHTITPDGKKHKVEKDAIFERIDGNYKERVFSFPQLEEGCILEYKYTIISKRFYYLTPWYFQGRLYTLQSNIAVRLQYGFDYNASFNHVPGSLRQPEKQEEINPANPLLNFVRYSWAMSNLPPIKDEPYMGSENDYRSSMRFQLLGWQDRYNYITFVSTWEELGNELLDDFRDYLNKKGEIKKLAEDITMGLTTPREQSAALYDYVKTNYETSYDYQDWYFAHEKVERLLEEKYGTAEGKNLVLTEMHSAIGLTAFPVLISTRTNGRIYADNPSRLQFNHLLTYIEFADGWEMLDATNRVNPYGILPPDCLVEAAFLLEKDKSQLIRVPDKPRSSCRTDTTVMFIDSEGSATCSTSCCFTGYYATNYAKRYERKSLEDFIVDNFADRLDIVYTLGEYKCELDSCGQLVVEMGFNSDELAEKLDNNLIVKPTCFAFRSNPFKSEKRFFPVDFQYPLSYTNVVKIYFPEGIENYQLPENRNFDIRGASFSKLAVVEDSCVTLSSTLKIYEPVFVQSSYWNLRDFFDKVALSSEDELIAIMGETE